MVVSWRTPYFEQFARRHFGSVKLGHRTPRTDCSRLRREKILSWTSSAPEPQLGPPLSLSLTCGPHLSSSSSSSSLPLLSSSHRRRPALATQAHGRAGELPQARPCGQAGEPLPRQRASKTQAREPGARRRSRPSEARPTGGARLGRGAEAGRRRCRRRRRSHL